MEFNDSQNIRSQGQFHMRSFGVMMIACLHEPRKTRPNFANTVFRELD
jgi:hypothetical protein